MTASVVTARATTFVADHTAAAIDLGKSAADALPDGDAVVARLHDGLATLSDPAYLAEQQRVAPGMTDVLGVRWPLLSAVGRGFRGATRGERSSVLLDLASRLVDQPLLELRWLGFDVLTQTVRSEPEQTWQLLRRAAGRAEDWVTVDALAHAAGAGIIAEPYRWAELEQLVYSPSRWERRLVGSTIATIPYVDRRAGRQPTVAERALPILADLVGDSEPDVQKSLSWALRSLLLSDPGAVVEWLTAEADVAQRTNDGHRAWVIRDVLPKLGPDVADPIRDQLEGIRRRTDAPSTSRAGETSARFVGLGVDTPPADRTVVERP